MKIAILKALHLLLGAGYSVSDAIVILDQQFKLNAERYLTADYDPICDFVHEYFPMWCNYPYASTYQPIDAVCYVDRCLQLIAHRRIQLSKMVQLLWYPLLLLVMAIIMGFIVVNSLQTFVYDPNKNAGMHLVFTFFLIGIIAYMVWLVRSCLKVTFTDWLVIIDMHFSDGWLLGQVIQQLTPHGRLLILWQRMVSDIIRYQSFTCALSHHFKLNASLKATLKTHETMGDLSAGIHAILPDLVDHQNQQFLIHIHVIRCLLYLFIVGVIFTLLWQLYLPIMSQNIM